MISPLDALLQFLEADCDTITVVFLKDDTRIDVHHHTDMTFFTGVLPLKNGAVKTYSFPTIDKVVEEFEWALDKKVIAESSLIS